MLRIAEQPQQEKECEGGKEGEWGREFGGGGAWKVLREIAKVEKGEPLMVGMRKCQGTRNYRNMSSLILSEKNTRGNIEYTISIQQKPEIDHWETQC